MRIASFVRRALAVAGALLTVALPVLSAADPGRPAFSLDRLERAQGARQRHEASLFAREGVVGVGLGLRSDGNVGIRVLVARNDVRGIPATIDDIPVEREVTGRLRSGELSAQDDPLTPRERWPRPVPIGVSAGHTDVTAGTIGCQVLQYDGCHTTFFALSNNHVFANQNAANPGDPILHPGSYDGGVAPADTVGTLYAYEPISFAQNANNVMDAALAYISTLDVGQNTPPDGYVRPKITPLAPALGIPVMKYGRTTSLTRGSITGINFTVSIDYRNGTARFVQQILINGRNGGVFSSGGDSGSLVVVETGTDARRPVGLIFAGAGPVSVANPIGPIMNRFGIGISGDP